MNNGLTILACQLHIPPITSAVDKTRHLTLSAGKATKWLTQNPAQVLLLPELSSLDYSNATFAKLDELAEQDNGESFQVWREIAIKHNCWVLYGFARRHHTSSYSIATGIIDPTGDLFGIYEKMHLAQFGASEEKDYFDTAGTDLVLFECNGFRLAPVICYDIRFPELARTLVLDHHADCILHTGAYARDPSFYSWHAFAKTRAMENQVYWLSLNRAGRNFGQSICVPPWVDENHQPILFADTEEQSQLLTLERQAIDHARKEYHFLHDRLADYNF